MLALILANLDPSQTPKSGLEVKPSDTEPYQSSEDKTLKVDTSSLTKEEANIYNQEEILWVVVLLNAQSCSLKFYSQCLAGFKGGKTSCYKI